MVRSGALIVALVVAVLFVPSPATPVDAEKQLLGVWKLESFYTEFQATGEKKRLYGEKPSGYLVFTPEKRMIGIITAEGRKKPETDEDRVAAFRSLISYSGIYRVEGDKWITKVDVSWLETWVGTDQMRFFRVDGDRLDVTSMWLDNPAVPGSPKTRGVLVWSRVKA
jgi:lipocalin-like protein